MRGSRTILLDGRKAHRRPAARKWREPKPPGPAADLRGDRQPRAAHRGENATCISASKAGRGDWATASPPAPSPRSCAATGLPPRRRVAGPDLAPVPLSSHPHPARAGLSPRPDVSTHHIEISRRCSWRTRHRMSGRSSTAASTCPQSWIRDPDRCAAGVPAEVEFATKPRLAQQMIEAALDAGVVAMFVTADECYGRDPILRQALQQRGIAFPLVAWTCLLRDRQSWVLWRGVSSIRTCALARCGS